jgi:hypothetical protein
MKAFLRVLLVVAGVMSIATVVERGLLDGPQHYAAADHVSSPTSVR